MKRIKINHYNHADKTSIITDFKKHRVALGNGLNALFTNINEVKLFFGDVNRFLNIKLFEMNEIYIEIRSNYHRLWFFSGESLEFQDNNIKSSFDAVEFAFKMMVTRSGWQNGNSFVFKYFYDSINNLTEVCHILMNVQKQRSNYPEFNLLITIDNRLKLIKKEIESFGYEKYNHVPLEDYGLKFKRK